MELLLIIKENTIIVKAKVNIQSSEYSFCLPRTVKVSDICNNGRSIICSSISPANIEFMCSLYRYDLKNLENGTLTFTYRGRFSGHFYFRQDNLIHFSYYNGWYPIGE